MTTIEETLTKLHELKLTSMAQAVRELMDTAPGHQLSFDEKLGLVVDREWADRDNRRLSRRLKEAKLVTRASLDNVLCDPERGVDKLSPSIGFPGTRTLKSVASPLVGVCTSGLA